MRLLILSCNTGQGHNSCANAVKSYFEQQGDTCDIADALGFISEKASKFISGWHSRLYRHAPTVFDKGYKYIEKHTGLIAEDSAAYNLLTSGAEELRTFIQAGNYDAVLCVHIFAGLLLSKMMMQYQLSIRTGLLATDYTCSPGFGSCNMDHYFIPDESLLDGFITAGVPENRIVASGIPVRSEFLEKRANTWAKRHFGINATHDHILMMCGSMGCGPMEEVAALLAESMDANTELSIICGTNEKLQKSLRKALQSYSNVHIHGFVKEIPLMMDSADLFLTKPGGISVSEAAVKRLPMVLIDAVSGCESGNLEFFLEKGAAKTANTPDALAALCVDFLKDKSRLSQMAENYGDLSRRDASAVIYQYMTQ